TGEAQRQAKLTGKTGEIEVAVPSLDASGFPCDRTAYYNTQTESSDGRFIYDKFPEKEYKLVKVNFATGDQFTKIAFLRSKDGTGTVTPEQPVTIKVLEGEDGKQTQIIETVPKKDLICPSDFRVRIYDPKTGEQIVEVVNHQIHHTDDGNTISGKKIESGEGDQQKSSQESQQTGENKISEESSKEESVRRENVENASIVGKIKKNINDSANVNISELGTLIYPVEIFTDSERKELSEVLNDSLLVNFISSGKIEKLGSDKSNYHSVSLSDDSTSINDTQSTNKGENNLIVFGVIFVLMVAGLAFVKTEQEHLYFYGQEPCCEGENCEHKCRRMNTLAYIQSSLSHNIKVSRTVSNANGETQAQTLVYNTHTRLCHFEQTKEKPTIIQLDENQYKHLLIALGNIIRELNSIAFKVKELENGMKLIEGELSDFIEIDNDVSRHRNSGYYFGNICEVRINCRYVCGHSHKEYDDMRDKYNALERERNDLRTDRDNWRKKHDELKDKLNDEKLKNANEMASEKLSRQSTESTLRNEKKLVEEKLETFKTEKVGLLKQIEDGKQELGLVRVEKDKQLALIENKLTQKDDKLKELEKAMDALRVGSEKVISQKENSLKETSGELKRKEQKIKELQNERFRTQEELLIEKLNSEKSDLEVVASELGINLEDVHNLIMNYKRLLFARKERKRDIVEDSEGKIAKTKQTLLGSEVSIENIRKISRECERLANLRVSETATPEEIKNAYRKLALKWHPDKWINKGSEEKEEAGKKMQEINKVYEVLGNEELRKRYDLGETEFTSDYGGYDYEAEIKAELWIVPLLLMKLEHWGEKVVKMEITIPKGKDRSEELKNFKEEMVKAIKEAEVMLRIREENEKKNENNSELEQARTVAFQEIEKSMNERGLKVKDLGQYSNYQERISSLGEVWEIQQPSYRFPNNPNFLSEHPRPRENPNCPPWSNPNPRFPDRPDFLRTDPGRVPDRRDEPGELVDEIKREQLNNASLLKRVSGLENKIKELTLKNVPPITSELIQKVQQNPQD
ncbi:2684_t:CDS:10, partial [Racocetra persica]